MVPFWSHEFCCPCSGSTLVQHDVGEKTCTRSHSNSMFDTHYYWYWNYNSVFIEMTISPERTGHGHTQECRCDHKTGRCLLPPVAPRGENHECGAYFGNFGRAMTEHSIYISLFDKKYDARIVYTYIHMYIDTNHYCTQNTRVGSPFQGLRSHT